LLKVTIIPRGRALGAAWYLPEERQLTTTEQILDEMAYALGGRASEEIMFNKISTGALSDLEKVTKQAYAMVIYFGMSEKLGNISFYDSSGQSEYGFTKPYSDKTAEIIDAEVKGIIEKSYERAKEVLRENLEGLKEVANLLLEREVIFSEDMERVFGKRRGEVAHSLIENENGNGDGNGSGEGDDALTKGKKKTRRAVKTVTETESEPKPENKKTTIKKPKKLPDGGELG
jgi:cell division protease FtsH